MLSRNKSLVILIATAVLTVGGGTLLAQQSGSNASQNDQQVVKLMSDHHMTLSKAIELAEQQGKGRAISAAVQMQGGDGTVSVTVVAGERSHHMSVDVKTGKVSESAAGAGTSTKSAAGKPHDQSKKKP